MSWEQRTRNPRRQNAKMLERQRHSFHPAGADTHDKIESHDAAARSEFWNFPVKARIRCVLEHGRAEIASFFRADRNPGVTESVSFGTWNRVSHGCSKTPKLQNYSRSQ
jgi:hypothetical protein